MVASRTIAEQPSSLDPLVLLPVPSHLPDPPHDDLQVLLSTLTDALAGRSSIPVSVLTSQLRLLNRNAYALLNAARAGIAETREELDVVDTELRGVEYELERIKEEIAICEDYTPIYAEIDLVDVEAFRGDAGAEVLGTLPAEDDEHYEYALTKARLEHELAALEQRQAIVKDLSKERDAVAKANKEIKMKFATADTYLTDYARSTTAMARKVNEAVSQPAPPASSNTA